MKVALDLRVLEEPALAERGIGRYAAELAAALARRAPTVAELRGLGDRGRPAGWPSSGTMPSWRATRVRRRRRLHSPSIDRATVRPGSPTS